MSHNRFIQPPDSFDLDPHDPLIFLGGPIQGAPKTWQYNARDIIHGIDSSIAVASPRKEYAPGTFKYYQQVNWEHFGLDRAGFGQGTVAFYLPQQADPTPGRAYGQTSRVEAGMWIMKKHYEPSVNLAFGMPGGFGNERYLKHMIATECADGEPVVIIEGDPETNLERLCVEAVRLALLRSQKAAR